MPIAIGVAVLGVGGAIALRIVGGYVSRPWSTAHAAVQRYALWSALPIIVVYLLVVSWPLAVVAFLLSPLIVLVLRSLDLPYGTPRSARPGP